MYPNTCVFWLWERWGSGRPGGGERTRQSHSLTTDSRGGWGWHGTSALFTQVPLCGSRVLGLQQMSPPQLNQPILRVLGLNVLCPRTVQNTPSLRDLCFSAAWNFLFLPFPLLPRLRTSRCCSSLLSGRPPAPLKGNSLPFSASPQTCPRTAWVRLWPSASASQLLWLSLDSVP